MIVGTKKMIVYDDIERAEKIKIYDKGVVVDKLKGSSKEVRQVRIGYRSGDIKSPNINVKEALGVLCSEFVESVKSRKKHFSDGEFGLSVVNVLEKATMSARKGKTVQIQNANSKRRKKR